MPVFRPERAAAAERRWLKAAWQARASRTLTLLPGLEAAALGLAAPEEVLRALDDLRGRASELTGARSMVEAAQAEIAYERAMIVLGSEIAQSGGPDDLAEEMIVGAGLMEPVFCREECDQAVQSFVRSCVDDPGDAHAIWESSAWRHAFFELSVLGSASGLHFHEAAVLRSRTRLARLALSPFSRGQEELPAPIATFPQSLDTALGKRRHLLELALKGHLESGHDATEMIEDAELISLDTSRFSSAVAMGLAAARHLHDPKMRAMLAEANEIGQLCARKIRDLGIPPFRARVLPTETRSEFNAMFPADLPAEHAKGAYHSHVNVMVLSPGHSELLASPDTEHPLCPVHLHELAHASASNNRAAIFSEEERALSEGYAEKVTDAVMPAVEQAMSERCGREVSYARVRNYETERSVLEEFMELDRSIGAGEHDLLAAMSRGPSMLGVIAERFCFGRTRRQRAESAREIVSDMLAGGRSRFSELAYRVRGRAGVPAMARAGR